MNKKKGFIIIILVVLIGIGIYFLYNTFAINASISNNDNIYAISLDDDTSINIPGNSSKTIVYHINNTNNGRVKYGIEYMGSNIDVKVYNNSIDKASDYIDIMGNKYIKLYIVNKGNTNSVVSLKTVLGYENGGDLILDDGYSLVSSTYYNPINVSEYIYNMYNSSSKSTVVNNSITYNYDTKDNLMNDNNGNIRYYGSNPNNYIYFNCDDYSNQSSSTCELWRIIGVFNIDNKKYVKIIRNESIGNYSWDSSDKNINSGNGINEWTQADLMKLLNPGYDSEIIGGSLYYNSKSGNCYSNNSNVTKACDFTSIGIKNNTTRNMIKEVTWNTGGYNSTSVYANQIYTYERSTRVVSNPSDNIKRTTLWKGKIALAYPSDYGYATDFNKCNSTLNNFDNSDDCINNDWLYSVLARNDWGWLLTPNTGSSHIPWRIRATGGISNGNSACYSGKVVPVLYLFTLINMEVGEGTINNPYRIY